MNTRTSFQSPELVSTVFLEYGFETLDCEWWDRIASWTVAEDRREYQVRPNSSNESPDLVTVTVSFSVPDPAGFSADETLNSETEETFQFSPQWPFAFTQNPFAFTHNIARRQFPQP